MTIAPLIRKGLTPVIYANFALMALSGLWLLSVGAWGALWPGIFILMLSFIVFPLLMLPAAFFAGVMQALAPMNAWASRAAMLASLGYLSVLMALAGALSFHNVEGLTATSAKLPALVWAVAAGFAPWALFASKDRGNVFFTGVVFAAQLGAVIAAIAGWYGFWASFLCIGVFMIAILLAEAFYEEFFLEKP